MAESKASDIVCAAIPSAVVRYRPGPTRLPYVSNAFRDICQQLGLRHLRTKPVTPRINGKAGRFIQRIPTSNRATPHEWPDAKIDSALELPNRSRGSYLAIWMSTRPKVGL